MVFHVQLPSRTHPQARPRQDVAKVWSQRFHRFHVVRGVGLQQQQLAGHQDDEANPPNSDFLLHSRAHGARLRRIGWLVRPRSEHAHYREWFSGLDVFGDLEGLGGKVEQNQVVAQ